MKKTYKSKISAGLMIFLVFIFFGPLAFMPSSGIYLLLLSNLIILGFIWLLVSNISYTIADENLIVNFGIPLKEKMDIKQIVTIKETNTLWSSPAASLDRLEIKTPTATVVISPKNKAEFIADLLFINPNIEVFDKKGNKI